MRSRARRRRAFAAAVLSCIIPRAVSAAAEHHSCSASDGGGVCPEKNTCCRAEAAAVHDDDDDYDDYDDDDGRGAPPKFWIGPAVADAAAVSSSSSSGCIPNDMPGPEGVCCVDDGTATTGCAPNYECVISPDPRRRRPLFCKRGDAAQADPLVETMPRYQLCSPPPGTLTRVHGLPVAVAGSDDGGGGRQNDEPIKDAAPALAYYSTHGDILGSFNTTNIRAAVVIIHGMGRNADDYFCSGTSAASLQTNYDPLSVLVVAPRFLDPSDGQVVLTTDDVLPMRWGGNGDKFGAWRYGADATSPPPAAGISSFDAMDRLASALGDTNRFPNLERIAVAGHSSGGQFVQRWALLSGIEMWERRRSRHRLRAASSSSRTMMTEERPPGPGQPKLLRAVVGNPSSYAYLDGRRFFDDGTFRTPSSEEEDSCPGYNRWEWGLDPGGGEIMAAPYKDRAIEEVGGPASLAERFADRDVIYLNGGRDRCNVAGLDRTGWCYSHGLETSCGDAMEGEQRLDRGEKYYRSLRMYFGRRVHSRAVVEGVGHDHSLMWESSVGLSALFDDDFSDSYGESSQLETHSGRIVYDSMDRQHDVAHT